MQILTKKKVLLISISLSLILLAIDQIGTYRLCSQDDTCALYLATLVRTLLLVFPLALLSLATYFLRDEIFFIWMRFARWFIPISIFLILISPNNKTDWMFPNDKGHVSFYLSILFLGISILIVLIKSLQVYRKK